MNVSQLVALYEQRAANAHTSEERDAYHALINDLQAHMNATRGAITYHLTISLHSQIQEIQREHPDQATAVEAKEQVYQEALQNLR